jgi:hypothetical protein
MQDGVFPSAFLVNFIHAFRAGVDGLSLGIFGALIGTAKQLSKVVLVHHIPVSGEGEFWLLLNLTITWHCHQILSTSNS